MRKEDLKDWTMDRLKDEIVNLFEKNFHLEWRIKQFDESEGRWKCEIENLRTENEKLEGENAHLEINIKSQREKINSLMKELEEEKGKTITISENGIAMRFDKWEMVNENKSLRDENKALKQRIKDLEDVCDSNCFSDEEDDRDSLIAELQDQNQQDCIRINDLRTAYLITVDELAKLREQFGVGR